MGPFGKGDCPGGSGSGGINFSGGGYYLQYSSVVFIIIMYHLSVSPGWRLYAVHLYSLMLILDYIMYLSYNATIS